MSQKEHDRTFINLIHQFDSQERWGKNTIWQSIYQLEALVKKIGSSNDAQEKTFFVLSACHHFFSMSNSSVVGVGLPHTAFSTRNLSGKGLSGSKGTVDLMLLKHQALKKFLGAWLEESNLPDAEKTQIVTAMKSFAAYHEYFKPGEQDVDLTWMSCLPEPARQYMKLIEAVVYKTNKDGKLKSILLAGGTASDFPDRDEFKSEFENIRKGWATLSGEGPQSSQDREPADVDMADHEIDMGTLAREPHFHALPIEADSDFQAKQFSAQEALQKTLNSLTEEEQVIVKKFEVEAMRQVRSSVSLMVESDQRKAMIDELSALLGGSVGSKNIMLLYDNKTAGEPITNPHIRMPSFRADRLKTAVAVVLGALDADILPRNLAVAVTDAGALGNKSAPWSA